MLYVRDWYSHQQRGGEGGAGTLGPGAGQRLQAHRLARRPGGPAQGRRLSGRRPAQNTPPPHPLLGFILKGQGHEI